MRLLTDEIKQRFEEYPLYSQEKKGINSTVIVFQSCRFRYLAYNRSRGTGGRRLAVIRILPYFLLGMGLCFLKRITGVKAVFGTYR